MEYFEVAAHWWAEKIRDIKTENFDNGDDSSASFFTMILAATLAAQKRPSNDAIDLFEKELSETISRYVMKHGSLILSVDYGPDATLSAVAEKTNISTDVFPWKTTMWIENDKVSVSQGYCSPVEILYPVSE